MRSPISGGSQQIRTVKRVSEGEEEIDREADKKAFQHVGHHPSPVLMKLCST